MSQTEHEPIDGNLLHPSADQGDTLTAEKETIVSVPQSTQDEFEPFGRISHATIPWRMFFCLR